VAMSPRPLQDLISVLKLRLSLFVALAALMGYLLRRGAPVEGAITVFFSMLALSAGAGCLNNWQDRTLDRTLERTCTRPLPAGRMSTGGALALACLLILTGLGGLLSVPAPAWPFATGLLAVILYNAVYTPMKPRTLYAMGPGVLCGVLPPLVGWLAAGGRFHAGPIWTLMTVFGLWQPPHFWLHMLVHQKDYRPGSMPSMLAVFSRAQVVRITFIWVMALAIALLALPLAVGSSMTLLLVIVLDVALLVASFAHALFVRDEPGSYRLLFAELNAAVFLAAAAAVLL
jgi:protoheme IX farnesyltransferase